MSGCVLITASGLIMECLRVGRMESLSSGYVSVECQVRDGCGRAPDGWTAGLQLAANHDTGPLSLTPAQQSIHVLWYPPDTGSSK